MAELSLDKKPISCADGDSKEKSLRFVLWHERRKISIVTVGVVLVECFVMVNESSLGCLTIFEVNYDESGNRGIPLEQKVRLKIIIGTWTPASFHLHRTPDYTHQVPCI